MSYFAKAWELNWKRSEEYGTQSWRTGQAFRFVQSVVGAPNLDFGGLMVAWWNYTVDGSVETVEPLVRQVGPLFEVSCYFSLSLLYFFPFSARLPTPCVGRQIPSLAMKKHWAIAKRFHIIAYLTPYRGGVGWPQGAGSTFWKWLGVSRLSCSFSPHFPT